MSDKLNGLIENLKNDLTNEMRHMMFYTLAASYVRGPHRNHLSEFFRKQAASEMEHVNKFVDLIIGLGGVIEPVAENLVGLNSTIGDSTVLLATAVDMENEVIENYYNRMNEAEELGNSTGRWVTVFLEEQLEHSRTDADNMRMMIKNNS